MMTEPASANMICPKCGQFQARADTCTACGVVIAKLRPEQPPTQAPAVGTATPVRAVDTAAQPTAANTDLPVEAVNAMLAGDLDMADLGFERSDGSGLKKKLVIPFVLAGLVLIGIGGAMLVNKLTGGSLNAGTMRHLGWFIIPLLIGIGAGCIGQAHVAG